MLRRGSLLCTTTDTPFGFPRNTSRSAIGPVIDIAVRAGDTSLPDAHMRDASVLQIILEGQAMILTGAGVDGYDATPHDGTAGWIDEQSLSR